MANQEAALIGQQFGNYRLLSLLGQGGFADVYLGEHIHLKTQAAIKVLHTRLTSDDREKFLTEARTIAHLEHPNIIRVWDFGVENGLPYLVMARAVNGSLRQLYPKGTRLAPAKIIPYVKQVASALHYAHTQRLVHRDVKPENMLLGKNQEVLLSDFGIALVAQSSRYQSTQDVVGTIAYMAPEQLQGKPSPASDQYALGIVVYEWLCGERPFQGSFMEIFGQHLSAPPRPLRELNPAIPFALEQAVLVALDKNPQERFGNIKAFANALENALAEANAPTLARLSQSVAPGVDPHAPTFANTQQAAPVPDTLSSSSTADSDPHAPTFVKPLQPSTPVPGALPSTPPAGADPNAPTFVDTHPAALAADPTPPPPPAGSSPRWPGSPGGAPPAPSGGGYQPPRAAPQPQPGTYSQPARTVSQKSALNPLVKVLSVILVVVVIAVGAFVGISILRQRAGSSGSPGQTAQQGGSPGSSNTTPGSNSPSTPGQPTSASLTPGNVTLPLAIKCVSCSYPGLTVSLVSISANTAGGTTLWSFTIANGGASQCSDISFSTFKLEDQTGTQFQSSGQANDNWSLNAGTSTNESPTLAMVPRASALYTLNLGLSASCTSGENIYQTENLQFVPGSVTGGATDSSLTPLTPKTPTLPLKIDCVQCSYPSLSLTLASISANSAGSVTLWHFIIANNGASACNNISFSTLQLEDPSGTQYQTNGQANDDWALNAGTQAEASPTFDFLPQTGVTYKLNIGLSGDCTDGENIYQTESIQF